MSNLLAAPVPSSTALNHAVPTSCSGVDSLEATHQETLEGLAESYWLSWASHIWQYRGDRSGPLGYGKQETKQTKQETNAFRLNGCKDLHLDKQEK